MGRRSKRFFGVSIVGSLMLALVFATTMPVKVLADTTGVITPTEFTTFINGDTKGVRVSFDATGFGNVTNTTVDLYHNDQKVVSNVGTNALYTHLNNGQVHTTSNFYAQGALPQEGWTPGTMAWTLENQPTKAVITVTDSVGTKSATAMPLVEPSDAPYAMVIRDTSPPSIPIGGTPNGSLTNMLPVLLEWQLAGDNCGSPPTYEVQYSQDNSFAVGSTVEATDTNQLPLAHLSDGGWYWHVRAKDASGNESAWSDTWTVTLDTQPAQITTNFSEGAVISGTTTIQTTVSDDSAVSWQLSIYDASDLTTPLLTSSRPTTILSSTAFANGSYVAQWTATDQAGNVTHRQISFTIQNDIPAGTGDIALPKVALAPLFFSPPPLNLDTMHNSDLDSPEPADPHLTQSAITNVDMIEGSDIPKQPNTNNLQATQSGWKLFGLEWYWWLLGGGASAIMIRQLWLKRNTG